MFSDASFEQEDPVLYKMFVDAFSEIKKANEEAHYKYVVTDKEKLNIAIYQLECLASVDDEDLDQGCIDIYFEDQHGNEGAIEKDFRDIAKEAMDCFERVLEN